MQPNIDDEIAVQTELKVARMMSRTSGKSGYRVHSPMKLKLEDDDRQLADVWHTHDVPNEVCRGTNNGVSENKAFI